MLPIVLPHAEQVSARATDRRRQFDGREREAGAERLQSAGTVRPTADQLDHVVRDASLVHPFYFRLFDDVLEGEDDPAWYGAEGKAALVGRVAREALGGVDPEALPAWGETRRVFMRHLLFGGKLPPFLGFDRGPIPVVGGRATVVQGQVLSLAGRESSFCPSWRFVTDLATDVSETALAGGPSDRRFSRWYASDVARWLAFGRKTLKPGS